jgi:predicted AlkP superfamily phosphohydrolase/phosphomutase
MERSVKKIMLIGWDGASPKIIEGMMKKGLLKNFAKLTEKGTFINALNPYPTITAQNWTTISTGAWPGRHGITGYSVHHPGDPLDKIHTGFNTAECSAEHIWDVAEKVGKKCILVNYETSWPPTLKDGIVVHGSGPNYEDEFHKITPDIIFSNESVEYYPDTKILEILIPNISRLHSDSLKSIANNIGYHLVSSSEKLIESYYSII